MQWTKQQTNVDKILHRKLKIEEHQHHREPDVNSGAPKMNNKLHLILRIPDEADSRNTSSLLN
jgi:hypothetical protein